ncbi:hypothetical protein BCR43DRAFT_474543 [Syncephalastrum racemosum]|uniref:RRM domain-containing protein n=1 Tax=Syncephalastrum racemosum TaxID=13706 RepID=A0A1X2HD51_SYNRA|nr:hypothetical protein BCR43DRAFT_474543 [Syncephalastrum racemosum]
MDLDQSLDDIIKKKKSQGSTSKKNVPQKQNPRFRQSEDRRPVSHNNGKNDNRHRTQQRSTSNQRYQSNSVYRTSTGFHTNKAKYTDKPSILSRTSLGQRAAPYHKPTSISTASLRSRNTPRNVQPDPSSIVITKPVSRQNTSNKISDDAYGPGREERFRRSPSPSPRSSSLFQRQPPAPQQPQNLSIRGLSGNASGLSIRGESGPSVVLISNLDPAATAEDVRAACMQFGQVLHCEVMTDRAGRSYGEAEVEFASKASAAECASKLDNEIADGRVLRAVLRQQPPAPRPTAPSASAYTHRSIPPGPSSYSQHAVRTVITPARSGSTSSASGKMYSDQMMASGPSVRQPRPDSGRFGFSRRQ